MLDIIDIGGDLTKKRYMNIGGLKLEEKKLWSSILGTIRRFLLFNGIAGVFKKELSTKLGISNNAKIKVGSLKDYGYRELIPCRDKIYFVVESDYVTTVISLDYNGNIKIHDIEEMKFQHSVTFASSDLEDSFENWKFRNGFEGVDIKDILLRLGITDDIDLCLEPSSFTAAPYFKKGNVKAAFCFYRKAYTVESRDIMYAERGHNIILFDNYIVMFDSISWLGQNPNKPQIYKITKNKNDEIRIDRCSFPPVRILRTSNNYISHIRKSTDQPSQHLFEKGDLDIDLRSPYCPRGNKKGPVGPNQYSEIFFRGLWLCFPTNCVWKRKVNYRDPLFYVPNDQEVKKYLESVDLEKTSILEILRNIQEITGCYIDFTGSINMTCKNPSGFETNLAIVHNDKDHARTFKLNDINGDKKSGRIECDTYLGYDKGTPMAGRAMVEYFVPEYIGGDGIKFPGIRLKYIFEGTEALDIPEELDITNYFLKLPYMPRNDYQYIYGMK